MRSTPLTLVFLLLGVVACGGGDDGDSGAGTGGSDSSGSTMGFPSTSDDSTDDTLTTVSATEESTSDADSTTATSGDPDTSSGGATETGNENLCMADADDDECYVCGKEMCCDEFMACAAEDPNCGCVLDCLAALDDPGPTEAQTCSDQCDADFISLTPFFMMITQCQLDNCNNECGG